MKKVIFVMLALLSVFALVSCTKTVEVEKIVEVPVEKIVEKIVEVPVEKIVEVQPPAPFEVGDDYTEYTMDGASAWANCYDTYLRVVADGDELFNGTVKLTSDGMYVGEILMAAGYENGFSTDGALSGFVMTIGEYVGGTNGCYWMFKVNGKDAMWACNEVHVFPGDYVEWSFDPYY